MKNKILKNPSLLNQYIKKKEEDLLKNYKKVVEESFKSIKDFQETIYRGKKLFLGSYVEWDEKVPFKFYIKTKEDIDLKKILLEKERGVGSKGENPTASIFRLKKLIQAKMNVKAKIKIL